jgi:hypothetical protein
MGHLLGYAPSHHRSATPPPGRRLGACRLLSGVHRDRQRRPQRPARPRAGPGSAPPGRHPGRLEPGPIRPVAAAFVDTVTRDRVPRSPGGDRHTTPAASSSSMSSPPWPSSNATSSTNALRLSDRAPLCGTPRCDTLGWTWILGLWSKVGGRSSLERSSCWSRTWPDPLRFSLGDVAHHPSKGRRRVSGHPEG